MAVWSLLATAIPAATNLAAKYITRPKEQDFQPQTQYMKKYLSYLRGRQSDREVQHMAMRPALRTIGGQSRQMQREIGYRTEKTGVGGSGIEAQQRLTAGQMTMEAMQTASEKATAAQMAESRRLGERAALTEAKIAGEEERAEQAYKTAKSQWGREMIAAGVSSVGNLAGQAVSHAAQQKNMQAFAEEQLDPEQVQSYLDSGMNMEQIYAIAQEDFSTQLYWERKAGGTEGADKSADEILVDLFGEQSDVEAKPAEEVTPVEVEAVEEVTPVDVEAVEEVTDKPDVEVKPDAGITPTVAKPEPEHPEHTVTPEVGKYKGQEIVTGSKEFEEYVQSPEYKNWLKSMKSRYTMKKGDYPSGIAKKMGILNWEDIEVLFNGKWVKYGSISESDRINLQPGTIMRHSKSVEEEA